MRGDHIASRKVPLHLCDGVEQLQVRSQDILNYHGKSQSRHRVERILLHLPFAKYQRQDEKFEHLVMWRQKIHRHKPLDFRNSALSLFQPDFR